MEKENLARKSNLLKTRLGKQKKKPGEREKYKKTKENKQKTRKPHGIKEREEHRRRTR